MTNRCALVRLAGLAAGAACISLLACGGGSGSAGADEGPSSTPGATGVLVALDPTSATLAAGDRLPIHATVTGSVETSVTWSVVEGSAGGAVDGGGLYTAPASAGTYHVVARSAADPTASAKAVVVVTDAGWVDVTAYGAKGDGVTDDTGAFRAAAATGKNLRVPRPSAFYRLTGNVRLLASMQGDGSMPEIRMFGANGQEQYSMFSVLDYTGSGLTISGVHLNGQWDGGTSGEWSHNILVKGSSNITIENNVLERPYGDNILLGGENDPAPSQNVVIRNNQLLDPRRCNIALVSSRHVLVTQNTIHKSSDYVSAIDLEPNPNPNDSDWDVQITKNAFQSPNAVAVLLYHFDYGYPSDGLAGGDVTVTGNTGTWMRFFTQVGNWTNVTQSGNG